MSWCAGWCPEVWDEILCWQSTAPGELAILPCPSYITGFDVQVIIIIKITIVEISNENLIKWCLLHCRIAIIESLGVTRI